MNTAIVVQNATKKFGSSNPLMWKRVRRQLSPAAAHSQERLVPGGASLVVAVDHVSFSVQPGEIFGILGPGGSGKSTLVRLLATQLIPDSGDIRVFGHDVVSEPQEVQRLINRVSVDASFFGKRSPLDNLVYGARMHGASGGATRGRVIEMLTRLGLDVRAINQPMETMSREMQQKVAIARALLSQPQLLLLDEPTAGLDPRARREVQAIVRELRNQHGITILLTTRDLDEAESLCDRVAVIEGGKLVALDTPARLKGRTCSNTHEPALDEIFCKLTGCHWMDEVEQFA